MEFSYLDGDKRAAAIDISTGGLYEQIGLQVGTWSALISENAR